MDLNTAVYVLDDGVMLSGNLFQFESIDHVAATCLPVIESILMRHHNHQDHRLNDDLSNISADDSVITFNLGGWSYGGVVATAVAKLLQSTPGCTLHNKLLVSKLLLFDSPLRASSASLHLTRDDDDYDDHDMDKSENISGKLMVLDELSVVTEGTVEDTLTKVFVANARNVNDDDIANQADNHFKACTDLLKKHYLRPAECKPLTCPIFDIRPRDDCSYRCPIEAIEELTTGKVTRRVVEGNHWTMLFNEHAISIANIVMSYLKE